MFDDPDRHRLMLSIAQHDRGIRRPRSGDVLQDMDAHGKPTAIVVELVDRGAALLEWTFQDRTVKVSRRKVSTLRKLRFIREGDPIDQTPAALHRRGQREVRAGDVLGDPDDEERLALVLGVVGDRVQLSWFETGRGSTRALSSTRWLRLVREG